MRVITAFCIIFLYNFVKVFKMTICDYIKSSIGRRFSDAQHGFMPGRFDSRLTLQSDVKNVVTRARKVLGFVVKNSRTFDLQTVVRLYYALGRSVL